MPITIIATVGSATANSFVTAAEMTTYCAARLNASVWTGADAQLPALVEATRDLSLLTWVGSRADETQALSWPRTYAPNPDVPSILATPIVFVPGGVPYYYAATVIPQRVKDATCELALQYLKFGTTDLIATDRLDGVIEKTVDVITTRWASPQSRAKGLARFPRVVELIGALLDVSASGLSVIRT